MKRSRPIIITLAALVPLIIAIITGIEIVNVLIDSSGYPFGTEFMDKLSIYQSRFIYVSYHVVLFVISLLTIFFAIKKQRTWYTFGLIVCLVLFAYPVLFKS